MSHDAANPYQVPTFSRVRVGDDFVIGIPDTVTFLAVSPDIVAVLDWLRHGRSLAETRELYETAFGDAEGLTDTLEVLAARGFLLLRTAALAATSAAPPGHAAHPGRFVAWVLAPLSRLFGKAGLALQMSLLVCAACLLCLDPALAPNLGALFFKRHLTLTSLAVSAISLTTLAIHELAHMAAAWRKGVRARFGFSHRLWMLVAETDLSGLWSLPRRKRLMPILAGPLADGVFCSLVVLLLFAQHRQWLHLGLLALAVCEAVLVVALLRLVWQCLLFVRTDFYYVVAHLLGCANLMADTETYLAAMARSVWRRTGRPDMSRLPRREMRAVQFYSVLWLLGRMVALGFLITVQIPLLLYFLTLCLHTLGDRAASVYQRIDTTIVAVVALAANALGFGMWVHSLIATRRRST